MIFHIRMTESEAQVTIAALEVAIDEGAFSGNDLVRAQATVDRLRRHLNAKKVKW